MKNAVFGKTMENVKTRMELCITTSDDKAIKWFSKNTYKNCNEVFGLYLIEMYKAEVTLDKPIYVGTSVLDLSQLCVMDFHYNVIENEFAGNYNLLYSDTDSLVYHIETPDLYSWIRDNKTLFDRSESKLPGLIVDANKQVLGKFKDELNSLPMKEFISLNSKVYSLNYLKEDKLTKRLITDNKKTLKGVSKAVVNNEITFNDYHKVLTTNEPTMRTVTGIFSVGHQLYIVRNSKVALSAYYDKMVLVDSITCVPFGFKRNN